jgi:hypothetical protein
MDGDAGTLCHFPEAVNEAVVNGRASSVVPDQFIAK